MPVKGFKKIKLGKKNNADSSLGHNKLILTSNTFLQLKGIHQYRWADSGIIR